MRLLNSSTSPNGQKPDSRHRRGVCVCSALVPTPIIVHAAAEGPTMGLLQRFVGSPMNDCVGWKADPLDRYETGVTLPVGPSVVRIELPKR